MHVYLNDITSIRKSTMATIETASIQEIANELASALVRISSRDETARLSLPLLYPGGSMVGVEISRLRAGFLVSDAGAARREAGLMGGERPFQRIAREIAERFAIRFDHNMMFDIDVAEDELLPAVVAVANAAKTAVENTSIHLATAEHADN
jgi:histone H3/H4